MRLRRPTEHDLPVLAALAAPLQGRDDRHVAYLGVDVADITAELAESTWDGVGVIAERDGELLGWLIGDVDDEMGRVWWLGPFVDTRAGTAADTAVDSAVGGAAWAATATALYEAARVRLPASVDEEEFAVDERFIQLIDWAIRSGFDRDPGSHVMNLVGLVDAPSGSAPRVRELAPVDHEFVAALHDELFPGTHNSGRALVDGHDESHRRLVLETDNADRSVVGYIAVERQPDGAGYIDYVGVATHARGRGYGAELVRAGVAELDRIGALGANLTVREQAPGVRDLYRSLGFEVERTVVPLRRGFRLP